MSLAQIERSQERKPEKKKETKGGSSASERKAPNVFMPDISGKMIDDVKKLKVLTPYVVATRFNLRLSVAKDFLEELERKGAIKQVSKSRSVRVYQPVD